MFTKKTIDSLEGILKKLDGVASSSNRDVHKYQLTDKYLQKTGDYTEATLKGEHVNAIGDKSKITNVEIPVTFIYKETAHAFLTGTFLTGFPIFSATATRQHEDGAAMLTVLTSRDQTRLGWVGNLMRNLDDVLKYNICAAEVLWTTKKANSATTKITEGTTTTGQASPIIYEGNEITRLDPYNLILDPSVEPSRVHIDGTFAGYVNTLNYIQLKNRYLQWNDLYTIKENIRPIIQQSESRGKNYTNYYYTPQIRKHSNVKTPTNDWGKFWGVNPTLNMDGVRGQYEEVVLYTRLIPKEHYMDVPLGGNPQVYKLIWINGNLAYVEPVTSGHEFLPIVVGQLYPGSKEVKSFTEYLQDLQDLATSMMTGTLDSMRRAVGDRGIYDPTRIRKQDIENPSPTGKVPITGNVYGQSLDNVYKHIPYNDNISGNYAANMNTSLMLAQQTTGVNGSQQGSFIKGNKTAFEFDTIMSNSQARLQLGALHLENSFFAPMKEILKLNYLIHAQSEEIENRQDGTTIKVDPALLRSVAPEYKMADGILPSTKLANTEVMVQAVNALSMDPMLKMEYDVGGVILSVLKQQGFSDIAQYRRTPEQQQQYMNLMAQQERAANAGSRQSTQQPPAQSTT